MRELTKTKLPSPGPLLQALAVFAVVCAFVLAEVYPDRPLGLRLGSALALGALVGIAHYHTIETLRGGRGWAGRPWWRNAAYLALHVGAASALVALSWAESHGHVSHPTLILYIFFYFNAVGAAEPVSPPEAPGRRS